MKFLSLSLFPLFPDIFRRSHSIAVYCSLLQLISFQDSLHCVDSQNSSDILLDVQRSNNDPMRKQNLWESIKSEFPIILSATF